MLQCEVGGIGSALVEVAMACPVEGDDAGVGETLAEERGVRDGSQQVVGAVQHERGSLDRWQDIPGVVPVRRAQVAGLGASTVMRLHYTGCVVEIDWRHRGGYIAKHAMTPA